MVVAQLVANSSSLLRILIGIVQLILAVFILLGLCRWMSLRALRLSVLLFAIFLCLTLIFVDSGIAVRTVGASATPFVVAAAGSGTCVWGGNAS